MDGVCAVTKTCFICVLLYLRVTFFLFFLFVFIHDFVRYHTTWNGNSRIGSGIFSSSFLKILDGLSLGLGLGVCFVLFCFLFFSFFHIGKRIDGAEWNGNGNGMSGFERGVWCSNAFFFFFFPLFGFTLFYVTVVSLEVFISSIRCIFPYRFGLIWIVLFYSFL